MSGRGTAGGPLAEGVVESTNFRWVPGGLLDMGGGRYRTQEGVVMLGVAVDYQYEIDVTKSKSPAPHSVIQSTRSCPPK
jgi:hypothetical protein